MIPKSTLYALVKYNKVVAKGSKDDMMRKRKKEGGTVTILHVQKWVIPSKKK